MFDFQVSSSEARFSKRLPPNSPRSSKKASQWPMSLAFETIDPAGPATSIGRIGWASCLARSSSHT
jgi:hypothetical protein